MTGIKIISDNRKAWHNYEILEEFEAGLVLQGTEVKSLRAGKLNMNDAYAMTRQGELWLINVDIPVYTHGNINNHEPLRTRKLLVHRREIQRLTGVVQEKGLSLIPLKMYWRDGRAKVLVGIGRGKKLYDKRNDQRERDWQREKERLLKQH